MASRYDALERRVGISEYVSSHDGFAAVVKARYSDFLVHEVDLNGNVACLDKIETADDEAKAKNSSDIPSGDENNSRKRKHEESATADIAETVDSSSKKDSDDTSNNTAVNVNWENFTDSLCKIVGDVVGKEAIAFLQQK